MAPLSAAAQQKVQSLLDVGTNNTGVPGIAFVAVDKNGEYLTKQASGKIGPVQNRPVNEDTVFWIASCTKMITGIACLQLVEQGKLALDDSNLLYTILPEVKAKDQVLVSDNKWEPRNADITLRMLLNHTAGFGYSFFNEKIRNYGRPTGFEEFHGDFKDIRDSPLVNQPGSTWEYGINIDWAGTCVERVSGLKLGDYFQKNIFEPLGIRDVTMFPDQHMRENIVGCAQRYPGDTVEEIDHPFRRAIYMADQASERDLIFQAGGHGCFAKPKEYCKIIATLLNNGTSPTTGKQMLMSSSVDEMFKNQIPQFPKFAYQPISAAKPRYTNPLPELYPQEGHPDQGWGLTFHITMEPGATGRGANTGWWAGLTNLFWWADREKGVGGMIASQVLPFGDPNVLGTWVQCEAAVYEGLAGK